MVKTRTEAKRTVRVHALWAMVLVLIGFHLFALAVAAAQLDLKKKGKKGTFAKSDDAIFITSDRMEVDRKKNTVAYKGHVVTVRGDLTMKSDTLTAIYDGEMQRLKEVVAEGRVEVTQGGRRVTGTRAIFDREKNTVTLTGKPVVHQGKSQVSGSRIVLFIGEDRGVVEGGDQGVKAVLFPEDLKQ